jgi:hypothetical protein
MLRHMDGLEQLLDRLLAHVANLEERPALEQGACRGEVAARELQPGQRLVAHPGEDTSSRAQARCAGTDPT